MENETKTTVNDLDFSQFEPKPERKILVTEDSGKAKWKNRSTYVKPTLKDVIIHPKDPATIEDNTLIKWVNPHDPTMIRDLLRPTDIMGVTAGTGVGKSTLMAGLESTFYEQKMVERGLNIADATYGFKMSWKDEGFPGFLHIDTEQDKTTNEEQRGYFCYKVFGKFQSPPNFLSLGLKGVRFEDKIALWQEAMDYLAQKGFPVKVVYMDHPGDFVDNINDLSEATAFKDFLEEELTHWGAAMVYCYHTNPGSTKSRGHIGTILEMKNASKIFMEKHPEYPDDLVTVNFHKIRRGKANFNLTLERNKYDFKLLEVNVTQGFRRENVQSPDINEEDEQALQQLQSSFETGVENVENFFDS